MLILSKSDVASLVSIEEAIEAVEEGFNCLFYRKVDMPPRATLYFERTWHASMPCILLDEKLLSIKFVSVSAGVAGGLPTTAAQVVVVDALTGRSLALIEGTLLTAIRTGAASAIATKYLSLKDADKVGIIGAGYQARYQLRAIHAVRSIRKVFVYDIKRQAARDFSDEMSSLLGVDVHVVSSPRGSLLKAALS